MTPTKYFSSSAFRLTAAYFGIFAITIITIFSVLYVQASAELQLYLRQRVMAMHAQLQKIAKNEGSDALAIIVNQQSAGSGEPVTITLFTNANGDVLAGDIQPIKRFSGWGLLHGSQIKFISKKKKVDDNDRYYAHWWPVAGGYLLIGHIDEDVEIAQEVILIGLAWSLGLTLLVTMAGGVWLSRRAQTRIRTINSTLESIARGKLDHRIPLSSANDDLDQVSIRINQTLDRLGALISSIRQVSTDIAHDLKTPIGHLKQLLETARSKAKSVKEYRKVLDDASGEIDVIVEIFDALLRIAQIEAGARKARFAEIDLSNVLVNVAEAYEQVCEDADFKLATNLAETKPTTIYGDRELLTQLFANVLENCFRHCPPGTEVNINLAPNSGGPVVQITDTGPGIPAEERKNVLRRLYRLDKSRTTQGSGLGLSLVAAIADLHNAKLELSDNEPGLCVSTHFPQSLISNRA